MGFNFGHWLVNAGKAIGHEFNHLATGVVSVAKAAIDQPRAILHELSGAVQGVAHEAGGALTGVSQALSMPLLLGGGAALLYMITQRR